MYNNAGRFVKKVKEDSLSNFLESLSFRVNGYGRFLQQDVSSFRQFFCNDMEFILIARGSSVLYTLDQTHRLTPGTLILLKPFQLYTAICQPGEKLYYYYIHFDVQPSHLTESYLQMISGDEMALVVPPGELPDFLPAFAGMQNDWRNESPGLMALIRSYLAILTVHLERRIQRDPSLTISGRPEGNYNLDMLSKALEYITGHLDEPFKLEDLCRHLGISPSGLYKLFRRMLHTKPSDYIAKARLRQAEILLQTTGCTISEAAKQCGFCSASHLSRQFKTTYGLSPTQFLQKYTHEKEVFPE